MRKPKTPGTKRDKFYRNPPVKPGSVAAQVAFLKAQIAAQRTSNRTIHKRN